VLEMKIKSRAVDGTVKYVWSLSDQSTTESVFVRLPCGDAACVSSQVGCSLECRFCASGLAGLKRNLSSEEIVAQVESMFLDLGPPGNPFEVGFMGMGEPMLNLGAVAAAVEQLHRRYPDLLFSVSTVGYPKRFRELLEFAAPVRLQISLHAPDDELRRKLIPRPDQSIAELLSAAADYQVATRDRVEPVVLNYLLFDGVNDSDDHARSIVDLLRGFPGRLRIARFNVVPEFSLRPSSREREKAFMDICAAGGISLYHFESMGTDVAGGCGQLRAEFLARIRRSQALDGTGKQTAS
jgi:23S rRNA (adenine2503-C2)-methyltransferase